MFSPIQKERRSVRKSVSGRLLSASDKPGEASGSQISNSAHFNQLLKTETSKALEAPKESAKLRKSSPLEALDGPFSQNLIRARTANLVGQLNSLGDQLRENPSLSSYLLYKSTLTEILELSTTKSNSFALSKHRMKTENQAIEKEFHVITIINKEMDSLLSLIRETHQDSLAIAEKLLSMKGLVLSVLL